MKTAQSAKYTMGGGCHYINLVILPKIKLEAVHI